MEGLAAEFIAYPGCPERAVGLFFKIQQAYVVHRHCAGLAGALGQGQAVARIVELPVHFQPRSRAAGKKIGWRDGVHAIGVLVRHRLS